MKYTGWKRTYISNLCTSGRLPHIPTKPMKFIPVAVRAALEKMQQGGEYGRRKTKAKNLTLSRINEQKRKGVAIHNYIRNSGRG